MVKAIRMVCVAAGLLIVPGAIAAQSVSAGVLGGLNLVNYSGSPTSSGWACGQAGPHQLGLLSAIAGTDGRFRQMVLSVGVAFGL